MTPEMEATIRASLQRYFEFAIVILKTGVAPSGYADVVGDLNKDMEAGLVRLDKRTKTFCIDERDTPLEVLELSRDFAVTIKDPLADNAAQKVVDRLNAAIEEARRLADQAATALPGGTPAKLDPDDPVFKEEPKDSKWHDEKPDYPPPDGMRWAYQPFSRKWGAVLL